MKKLTPPDSLHLQAAEGWIGLGNYADANDELGQFDAANRAHPDVLQLRWRIYAAARKWDACLNIATALTTMTPERRFGWIHRAHTLDKLGRTLEAKDLLLSVVDDLVANSTIPVHLAQYCARLGQIDEAKQWLAKAFLSADGMEAVNSLRKMSAGRPRPGAAKEGGRKCMNGGDAKAFWALPPKKGCLSEQALPLLRDSV